MRQIETVLEQLKQLRDKETLIHGSTIQSVNPVTHASTTHYPVLFMCHFKTFSLRFHQNLNGNQDGALHVQVDLTHSDEKSDDFEAWCKQLINELEKKCSDNGGAVPSWSVSYTLR